MSKQPSVVLALGLAVLALAAGPAPAQVFSNPAPITINDQPSPTIGPAVPYPAQVAVTGMTGTVTGLTVQVFGASHTFPGDIDVVLVGPTGASLILMSDQGGGTDIVGVDLTIDDAAATAFPAAIVTGTYRPTDTTTGDVFPAPAPAGPYGDPAPAGSATLASVFNGTDPNGAWSLYLVDDAGGDDGNIAGGFRLNVTTTGTPVTAFSNAAAIRVNDGRGTATPYPATITVSSAQPVITSMTVTLNGLSHLNPDDLDLLLVGPTGASLFLTSDAGGATDVTTATVTFDDAAAALIPDAGPLVAGTFRPTNYGTPDTVPGPLGPYGTPATAGSATLASVFAGTNPNGTWSLYVVDDATASAGTVASGWSISFVLTPVELTGFTAE